MRLLLANLRKLRRRPATWVTFLLLVGLQALVTLLIIVGSRQATEPQAALAARMFLTFPGAYELILAMILGIGGLLAVTYGAAVAGSEWSWGTFKAAVARGESRTRYTLLGYGAVAVFTWIGILAAFVVGVVVSTFGALAIGAPLDGMGDTGALLRLPELFARAGLAMAMNAALGYAIATLARSQLAGIGVGIGLYFAEGIAGIFAPSIVRWLPFAASSAVMGGASGEGMGGSSAGLGARLDPGTAVLATIAWLVVSLLVASLWAERAEISG